MGRIGHTRAFDKTSQYREFEEWVEKCKDCDGMVGKPVHQIPRYYHQSQMLNFKCIST